MNSSEEMSESQDTKSQEIKLSKTSVQDLIQMGKFCSCDILFCGLIYNYGFHISQITSYIADLDPLLTTSVGQLLTISLMRGCVLMFLSLCQEKEFVLNWRAFIRLGVFIATALMYIHQVVRLLLDSESGLEMTFPLYIILHMWIVITTCIFGYTGYFILLKPPVEVVEEKDKAKRKGKKKDWFDTKDVPIWATLVKVISWYKQDGWMIIAGHALLFCDATVKSFSPHFKAKVIDIISSEEPAANLYRHAVLLTVVTVIGTFVSAAHSSLMIYIRSRMQVRLRRRLFRAIVHRDMSFFDTNKSGEITATLTSDAESLGNMLGNVDRTIGTSVRLVSMAFFMWTLSWQLTLVVILGNAILVSTTTIYGQYMRSSGKKLQECRRAASNIVQEVISNIRVVRSHGNEDAEVKCYSDKIQELAYLQLKDTIVRPAYSLIDQLLSLGLLVSTVAYGGHLAVAGRITSGDLVSFIMYMSSLGGLMSTLLWTYNHTMRGLGSCDKVFKYLEEAIDDSNMTKVSPEQIEGQLEFNDVSFTYPSRPDNQVLKNLSFRVEPGEVVALVGPSGAGKSTCFSLLQKFYEPDTGCVTLDRRPLTNYQHKYYYKKVAMVAQEPVLFARSIKDNISYAMSDVSDDAIKESAMAANAHGFISDLKDQYETEAGERGIQLSGGQKQRIAIARSIIRNPKIVLLDEATSALDAESEQQVQDAIYRNLKGRTVLIIAHRLSTVQKADRILVMENGGLAEQGTHYELLEKRGLYFRLVEKQLFKRVEKSKDSDCIAESKQFDSLSLKHQEEDWSNCSATSEEDTRGTIY